MAKSRNERELAGSRLWFGSFKSDITFPYAGSGTEEGDIVNDYAGFGVTVKLSIELSLLKLLTPILPCVKAVSLRSV